MDDQHLEATMELDRDVTNLLIRHLPDNASLAELREAKDSIIETVSAVWQQRGSTYVAGHRPRLETEN